MNARRVLIIALAGLAAAVLIGSAALSFAMLAVALLCGVVMGTGARVLDNVSYERSLSRRIVPWGGEIEVTTTVTNGKWLPLVWLFVSDAWPASVLPLGFTLKPSFFAAHRSLSQAFSVRWFQRVRRRYRGQCVQRGVHAFGPAELRAVDPLGISEAGADAPAVDSFVVLPKILAVPELRLTFGWPLVAEAARRSRAHDPTSVLGVRPYRAGDPLRAVNWRAVARTGELCTNEYEPSVSAEIRILLNMRVHQHAWESAAPDSMELLCVAAASAAAALTQEGFAVGLHSNASMARLRDRLAIETAPGSLPQILDHLARIVVAPTASFRSVLERELEGGAHAGGYLVITPDLDDELTALVRRLKAESFARILFVGDGSPKEPEAIDWRLPGSFDWRAAGALPLA